MVTEIINQDDLVQHFWRRAVHDAGDGTQEHGVGLVMEDDDDRGRGEARGVASIHTPGQGSWDPLIDSYTVVVTSYSVHISLVLTWGLLCRGSRDREGSCRCEIG